MKRLYIVTGANGFLGNNIIRRLERDEENEIRALVLPGSSTEALKGLRCRIFYGDVTRPETLEELFSGLNGTTCFVIHCAAMVYIKSKQDHRVYDVNVTGTKNIIEKVLEHGAKLVYVNSVHALPEKPNGEMMSEIREFDPDRVKGQYAKTKAEAARYVLEAVRTRGLNACIVHPSGIIGPGDFGSSHLTQLILDFANGRLTACVKGGYDFVDVRDVACGVLRACDRGEAGECYLLTNRFVEVKELLDQVSEVRGVKKIRTVLPMWLARLTAPLSELYYAALKQPPLYTSYSLYTLTSNSNFSKAKAEKELGYRNRPLEETVKDTVKWLEDQGRIGK